MREKNHFAYTQGIMAHAKQLLPVWCMRAGQQQHTMHVPMHANTYTKHAHVHTHTHTHTYIYIYTHTQDSHANNPTGQEDDSVLLSWGANCCGQLGLGDAHPDNVSKPALVRFEGSLQGLTALACGTEHSVMAMADGHVWSWGRNVKGQLGNAQHPFEVWPERKFCDVPTPVVFDRQQNGVVVQIACGDSHTVLLMRDGSVWVAGHNRYTQLGLIHGCNSFMLTPLSEPKVWQTWKDMSASRIVQVRLHVCVSVSARTCWRGFACVGGLKHVYVGTVHTCAFVYASALLIWRQSCADLRGR
jgi:alpha-tubulin suppressor-like RCC1 family protein